MADEPIRRKITWSDDEHAASMAKKRKLPENTIYAEWGDLETRRDMLLLGTMFWIGLDLMEQTMRREGLEMSVEIANNVMRAMQVMMKNIPKIEAKLLSTVLHRDANLCVKAANAPTPRAITIAVAHLIVKLTDEDLVPDPTSNLVLAALAIVTEAVEDGLDGPWRYVEREVVLNSERIWQRAQLAGYLSTMVPRVRPAPTRPE